MQKRSVSAIANAVVSSTPTAIRAAVRLASAAPMPPGAGIRLESTDADVDEEELRQRQVDAVGKARRPERERIERLGDDVAAEQLQPLRRIRSRSTARRRHPDRGHDLRPQLDTEHHRDAHEERDHDRRDETAVRRADLDVARIQGDVNERERDEEEAIWTIVSDTSSTAPATAACPVGTPIRCRKPRFMAIRPAELGTVRLMNLIADCRTMHGSSGSGAATAPRTEIPGPRR